MKEGWVTISFEMFFIIVQILIFVGICIDAIQIYRQNKINKENGQSEI
jgi:hypothetical protein